MSDLENLPPLREVIAAHGLRAEKKLGQNFLLDLNITDKIVKAASDLTSNLTGGLTGDLEDMTVFEIGPGPGGLTRSLLKAGAKKIIAIEYDSRAVNALHDLVSLADGRLQVIHGDALKTDLLALAPDGKRVIIANLPYNIATPLLINWLKQIRENDSAFEQMILMFQREVADRITAEPGNKIYGRLSVISQWLCNTKRLFDLPAQAFTPPPKVKSSIVAFTPKTMPQNAPSFETMETLTESAFGQRRKMLRTSLKGYSAAMERAGIDPTRRAETLSVADFARLAMFL